MAIDHKESGNPGMYTKTMKSGFWSYFFFNFSCSGTPQTFDKNGNKPCTPEACTYTTNSSG